MRDSPEEKLQSINQSIKAILSRKANIIEEIVEGHSCEVGLERETKKGRIERKKKGHGTKRRELAKLANYIFLFTFK